MNYEKKIKIEKQAVWPHLRSGWNIINEKIMLFNNSYSKIIFEDYLDAIFGSRKTINRPWVGFFHNTPKNHIFTNVLYGFKNDTSLDSILNSDCFKSSLKYCKGIFTLSLYLKDFIKKAHPEIPIDALFLCTEEPNIKFNFDKFVKNPCIVTIGHWQRLYNNINKIRKIEKFFLKWSSKINVDWWFQKQEIKKDQNLKVIDRLSNQEYDNLLERAIVFLELFDAAANNIVVECIVRNNPIIVNRLPGLYDYLGEEYPLFYDDFDHAQRLVNDYEKIKQGVYYLNKMNKDKFKPDYFVSSFGNSNIYSSLPNCKILL